MNFTEKPVYCWWPHAVTTAGIINPHITKITGQRRVEHSNHPRNLSDDQLKAIAQRGGLIGLNAFPAFIDIDNPSINRFIDHIDYIANLVGIEHMAFGFDFIEYLDFYFPEHNEKPTLGLDSVTCVPNLLELLRLRGYLSHEIEAMAKDNFLRFLKKAW